MVEQIDFEADVIDITDLPFHGLDDDDVRQLHGLPFANFDQEHDEDEEDDETRIHFKRGNYIAAAVQAVLRKKVGHIPNRHKNLAAFLELPLELILEVFEHLHPLDLYNMIRTTKSMRNILLTRKASLLWETVFHRHPDILSCPTDVSPPKWASLLFGPATCDICTDSQATVDFTCRQRLCHNCLPKYWVSNEQSPSDFLPGYPEEVDSLWGMVRYTYRSMEMHYPQPYDYANERRYWKPDLLIREKEMLSYLSAIKAGIPNAREAYASYKAAARGTVLSHMMHVRACVQWSLTIWSELDAEYTAEFSRFCAMIRSRLIKRHNSLDVKAIRNEITAHLSDHFMMANHIRFSKKELHRHLPRLEALAREAKEKRILQKRKERIGHFYENVCQPNFDPIIWDSLPFVDDIMSLDPIAAYIRSPIDSVGAFSQEEVEAAIMNFATTWRREQKQTLLRLLADSHPTLKRQRDGELLVDEGVLELATAIFYHPQEIHFGNIDFANAIIGWDDASVHLSCRDKASIGKAGSPELDFCQTGYVTAVFLLRLLGLNPDTTLAKDVTALNKRFMCMCCKLQHKGYEWSGPYGAYAWTWKECIAHVISIHCDEGKPPCFALLTDEMTEPVLYYEQKQKYPSQLDPIWACRHCSTHFETPALWYRAIQHVKIDHAIRDPIEGVDFFYRQNKVLQNRAPFFLETGKTWNYFRCLVCQSQGRDRLQHYGEVEAHLEKTHRITGPVEGIHWKRLKLINQTTDELQNEMKAMDIDVSVYGHAAVVLLLHLLGLDPKVALERDVTGLNRRFLCVRCPLTRKNRVFGTCAMNWKECVRLFPPFFPRVSSFLIWTGLVFLS